MPRLFIAVDIPKDRIAELKSLEDESLNVRWTRAEQHHLTLRFLGNVDDETTDRLAKALSNVSAPRFELNIEGLRAFPSLRRPRVIVAGMAPSPDLLMLQKAVDEVVTEIGIEPDTRPFDPHITLGRLRPGVRPAAMRAYVEQRADFRLDPFEVTAFHLYRSDLGGSKGAVHTILNTYPLKN